MKHKMKLLGIPFLLYAENGSNFNLKDSTHMVRIGPHGEPEFQVSSAISIDMARKEFSKIFNLDSNA